MKKLNNPGYKYDFVDLTILENKVFHSFQMQIFLVIL